ncbi:DNA-binding protein [Cupriavidus sp. USMAA2-4]|uniref:DNA-binding protein n=1 Tax=Cupriavidus malaysiensis TaxID=367825 RepID=A0ABN4TR22_9BURK|nr:MULTISPECIES: XRE family transcriptional regulator [Cupriavidus]AOY96515.1 DNA-binding protein [Cupriavidus sp. USMAA2-4]AOZ03082.1 DNA-binding protein [Cupriavidus sp. USMAHM13]AOZ09554.1 DNA-binding protein [Cupriavidus malaysiensis]
MVNLPHRLRTLRRQRGLSLEALAEQTGLTRSYLSKLERGLSSPSIATVLKIAQAYGMGTGHLLGDARDSAEEVACVSRASQREPLSREGESHGYRYEAIAAARKVKAMEPFVMHPPSDFPDEARVAHSGEEFLFVLKGQVEVQLGEELVTLASGDALYFDADLPHRVRSVGSARAEVLVTTTR